VAEARAELADLQEQIATARAELAAHQEKVPDLIAAHRAILDHHGRMYAELQDLQATLESLAPLATAPPGPQIVVVTSERRPHALTLEGAAQRAPGALPAEPTEP